MRAAVALRSERVFQTVQLRELHLVLAGSGGLLAGICAVERSKWSR